MTITVGPWASPPETPVPRRRGRAVPVLLICAGLGALMFAGGSAAAVAIPNMVNVEITGPGTAHVVWWVDGVARGVEDPAQLPWGRDVEVGVEVTAQLNGTGEIACTVGDRNSSKQGAYPWVACPIR